MSESNMSKSKNKYRNWLFTQFSACDRCSDPLEILRESKHYKHVLTCPDIPNRTVYYAVQLEECPRTGKYHYQGYIEFDSPVPFAFVKALLKDAHWESRKGNQKQAIDYCTKEDTRVEGPWIYGTPKQAGARTDITALYAAARSGQTHRETAEQMPASYMRYYKAFTHIQSMYRPANVESVTVTLLLGPSNTGKTTWARALGGSSMWINSVESANWYDGYDNHEDVLFDEFNGHIDLMLFLRLLAGFTERVPVKGGHCWWKPTRIYITSNYHPKLWYSDIRPPSMLALLRRITKVITFDGFSRPVTQEGLDYFSIREQIDNVVYFTPDAIKKESS